MRISDFKMIRTKEVCGKSVIYVSYEVIQVEFEMALCR